MKLFVEILPAGDRRDWSNFRPWGAKFGRVLKSEPRDWSTAGYWRVLDVKADLDAFSNFVVVE